MPSVWQHPKSKYLSACFTVWSKNGTQRVAHRWKRSVKTRDKALAGTIARRLQLAADGRLTIRQISCYLEELRISQPRVGRQVAGIFRDITAMRIGPPYLDPDKLTRELHRRVDRE